MFVPLNVFAGNYFNPRNFHEPKSSQNVLRDKLWRMMRLPKFREINFRDLGVFTFANCFFFLKKEKKLYFPLSFRLSIMFINTTRKMILRLGKRLPVIKILKSVECV